MVVVFLFLSILFFFAYIFRFCPFFPHRQLIFLFPLFYCFSLFPNFPSKFNIFSMWNVVTFQNDFGLVLAKLGLAKLGAQLWPNLDLAKLGLAPDVKKKETRGHSCKSLRRFTHSMCFTCHSATRHKQTHEPRTCACAATAVFWALRPTQKTHEEGRRRRHGRRSGRAGNRGGYVC